MQCIVIGCEHRRHIPILVGNDVATQAQRKVPRFRGHIRGRRSVSRLCRGRSRQQQQFHYYEIERPLHPPSFMVIPTSAPANSVTKAPMCHGLKPAYFPNLYPVTNSRAIAMPFEMRNARNASVKKRNGSTTGNVESITSKKTANAPLQSSGLSRGCSGGSGKSRTRTAICATSSVVSTLLSVGGKAYSKIRWISSGVPAVRSARNTPIACPRSLKAAARYMNPSMIPQARLQPMALTSISRTSARPASATLREHVIVSTIIRPNQTSEVRSIGDSNRARESSCSITFDIPFTLAVHFIHSEPDARLAVIAVVCDFELSSPLQVAFWFVVTSAG